MSSALVFDLETTGLPRNREDLLHPEVYANFDTCRIVSISWIVEKDGANVSQAYHIICPDDFTIPESSTRIHGISQAQAEQDGIPFAEVATRFLEDLREVDHLVAHNIEFDYGVMKAELLRRGYTDIAKLLDTKTLVCTMKFGREHLGLPKAPKLAELYGILKGIKPEDMQAAHNAFYDTLHCFECYVELQRRYLAQIPETIPFALSEQQRGVVDDAIHRHMLVIACAGSGKTTTILCRIWRLLRLGVHPSSITLTTFTRLAADDMRTKLGKIIGFVPPVEIGTIDSLCLKYIKKYQKPTSSEDGNGVHSVQEYGHNYYEMLCDPELRAKMLLGKRYLFVDEFQDINDIQFKIIDHYARHGVHVTAIGDDAQNIYSFRGSRMEYILNFTHHFPGAVVHTLTTNYRSNPPIVAVANACIEHNEHQMPKTMVSHYMLPGHQALPGTLPVKLPIVKHFSSAFLQNEDIVEKILLLKEKGIPYHEIAVLCYQNSMLFPLEEMLTRVHVPNIYADKAERTGGTSQKKLNHVFLGTFHKSKGLEWRVVFLIHLNDDLFPSRKDTTQDIEEARRLFYVAMTRAKERLFVYYSQHSRGKFASRFINELPKTLYRSINHGHANVGLSTNSLESPRVSITKLVEALDGTDFVKLKKKGILPASLAFDKTALYSQVSHSEYIEKHDLYSDFGIFLDHFICRLIGVHFPTSNGLTPQTPLLTVANVKLTRTENEVYGKYRFNFCYNTKRWDITRDTVEDCLAKLDINDGTCLESHRLVPVKQADHETLVNIIHKMITMAKQHALPVEQIAVMTERFLPQQFEKEMLKHLGRFQDSKLHWLDVLEDIWTVSKCDKVIKEKRRRLLFKHIPMECLAADYTTLYHELEDSFIPFLAERFPNAQWIKCHEYMRMENGLLGEPDIRIDDTIIDIKCSKDLAIKGEWIVQLLGYVVLARAHGITVNTIAIFNPLSGLWCEADVSTWAKGEALLNYLMSKKLNGD